MRFRGSAADARQTHPVKPSKRGFFSSRRPTLALARHAGPSLSIAVKPLPRKACAYCRRGARGGGVVFPHVVVANSRLAVLFSGNYVCTARTDVRHARRTFNEFPEGRGRRAV